MPSGTCATCAIYADVLTRYQKVGEPECGTCWKYRTRHDGKQRPVRLASRQSDLSFQRFSDRQPTENYAAHIVDRRYPRW